MVRSNPHSALDKLQSAKDLIEDAENSIRASLNRSTAPLPQSSPSGGCDDFFEKLSISESDLDEMYRLFMSQPELVDTLRYASLHNKLAWVMYVGLDPITQKIFKILSERAKRSLVRSLEDNALINFIVYLRNLNASLQWTLEDAPVGKQIVPNDFDCFNASGTEKRGGLVIEALFPRIPQVRHLRGVAIVR